MFVYDTCECCIPGAKTCKENSSQHQTGRGPRWWRWDGPIHALTLRRTLCLIARPAVVIDNLYDEIDDLEDELTFVDDEQMLDEKGEMPTMEDTPPK